MEWDEAWEGGSRGRGYVYIWLNDFLVQQKPLQHCKSNYTLTKNLKTERNLNIKISKTSSL